MKVIIDLMEAYSEHVGLPLLLINVENESEYEMYGDDSICSHFNPIIYLLELKNTAIKQNKPTIISVTDELNSFSLFYIITPCFLYKYSTYFIAVGPFVLQSENQETLHNESSFIALNDEEIEDRLCKIKNLYSILAIKEKVEKNLEIPEQIIKMLQRVENSDYNLFDFDYFIYNNLEELLNIDGIDFIGIAQKNKSDIFVVKYVNGENVQHLLGKKFYMGEGLLGNAGILGKDFFWRKDIDTRKPAFLLRFGIYPNHLFGITIKNDSDEVEIIVFGGSFQEKKLSENTLKLVKFIINYVFQKREIKEKLLDSEHVQSILVNLLELIDIAVHTEDKKYILYKLLDFCQTLNKGKLSCFSSIKNDFLYRGKLRNEIYQLHQQALDKPFQNKAVWIQESCIHFLLEQYGLFTVEFDEKMDLYYASFILEMINKVFRKVNIFIHNSEKEDISHNEESVFQILYTSMKEMNPHQFDLSNYSVMFAEKISEKLKLTREKTKMIINICKVLPFRFDYLKKQIAYTKEWELLSSTINFINNEYLEGQCQVEVQILAFIYKVIIQKEPVENIEFIDKQMMELLLEEYNVIFSMDQFEIDDKQIEEMTDLRSVITTLSLTPREKEILYLILEGLNNHEVAEYLKISVHTVKNHVTNIFKKLNVSDRFQAMVKIYRIKYGEESFELKQAWK